MKISIWVVTYKVSPLPPKRHVDKRQEPSRYDRRRLTPLWLVLASTFTMGKRVRELRIAKQALSISPSHSARYESANG